MMKKHCGRDEQRSPYVDGELDESARRKFEQHLPGCSDCQGALEDLRALRLAFRSLPGPEVGFDLAPAILARARRRTPVTTRWLGGWQLLPVSFAAAATLALGVFLGIGLHDVPEPQSGVPTLALFEPLPPGSVCVGFFSGCYPEKEI